MMWRFELRGRSQAPRVALATNCWNLTRRTFLAHGGLGFGAVALRSLAEATPVRGETSSVPDRHDGIDPHRGAVWPRHHAVRAKRVIFLCMAGGPSHLETLDYKPKLAEMHGQPMPESVTAGQPIAQLQGQKLTCFAPQYSFARYGQAGQEISTVFRHLPKLADDICIVRSMKTEQINHDPAHTFMNTGTAISGRPSMGAWVVYGLGRETDDLPGFVVMTSSGGGQDQPIAARQWHSGFLPSTYQGVQFLSTGDPVPYVNHPSGVTDDDQRRVVDAVNRLNGLHFGQTQDAEALTRIAQYEMAFRMQASVPGLLDFSDESQQTLDAYGTRGGDGSFAANCLLARRLAERGVRFIQLYHRGWDHHGGIKRGVEIAASHVDQATTALVMDLKQRGLLDDTLVVWAGEFGRTPMAQGDGRDHHIKGFSLWLAGGGIRPGMSYGATDEFGYHAVDKPFHVHDLHATMLHLLGIDHLRLTFPTQGRDFRLTDVHGAVAHEILA